jgi:1,4-dihydroxy-2-naphthoate octaprenyltransferase
MVRTATRTWVAGARPRTLPAAVVPVAVGTAVAATEGGVIWWRGVLALVVALALQIGVNYANDYSDGIRGTDLERVGPVRLTAGRLASPGAVRNAAFGCFLVAGIAGLVLSLVTTPILIAVGAAAVAAAWYYTGGRHPYGYAGFGEAFVFVFFGVVAVVGTAFVSLDRVTGLAVLSSIPVGLLATGVLAINNLRDLDGDRLAGKRTLAVRLGTVRARWFYVGCMLTPFALLAAIAPRRGFVLLALLALPLAARPIGQVRSGARGAGLIAALGETGRAELAFGVLLSIGLVIR